MYDNLMKETPMPYAYTQSKSGYNPASSMTMPPWICATAIQWHPIHAISSHESNATNDPRSRSNGTRSNWTDSTDATNVSRSGQMIPGQGQPQTYTTASSQNYNNSAHNLPGQEPVIMQLNHNPNNHTHSKM
ncbi:uncharacterized protein LOC132723815 [Ruditapes philippinarum]|uniref:uncharacterized protein LOC132723815 n=1 Tax=Ruditapes philippinarum TaxID=129788 RepID=UPI00295B8454|nr:uncharacterized protein LOC132723815 [Ruditapes philippinarum]